MYMLTETIIKDISYLSLWRCWPSVCQPLLQGCLADFHDYLNFIITSTTQRIFCLLLYNLEYHGNPDMQAVPILLCNTFQIQNLPSMWIFPPAVTPVTAQVLPHLWQPGFVRSILSSSPRAWITIMGSWSSSTNWEFTLLVQCCFH